MYSKLYYDVCFSVTHSVVKVTKNIDLKSTGVPPDKQKVPFKSIYFSSFFIHLYSLAPYQKEVPKNPQEAETTQNIIKTQSSSSTLNLLMLL